VHRQLIGRAGERKVPRAASSARQASERQVRPLHPRFLLSVVRGGRSSQRKNRIATSNSDPSGRLMVNTFHAALRRAERTAGNVIVRLPRFEQRLFAHHAFAIDEFTFRARR
jgi:hypothetical protein